ncbi:MAG: hypothetical protein FWC50_03545 [Planctomycetaceae bacterium]|nr:hypothetical protein [Planctomycetaceae bacterium]
MGRLSRNKGKTGERELARELQRVLGATARRGVQYTGGADSPDVVTDIDNIHIECKRTEHFRLFEALDQSIRDAGESNVPVVMHRPNHRPWVVVLRLDDLPALVETINQFQQRKNDGEQN